MAVADKELLAYRTSAAEWINQTFAELGLLSNVSNIDDLNDVAVTSVADNEVLAYDNATSEWINQTAAEAGLSVVGHSHDISDDTNLAVTAPIILTDDTLSLDYEATDFELAGAETNLFEDAYSDDAVTELTTTTQKYHATKFQPTTSGDANKVYFRLRCDSAVSLYAELRDDDSDNPADAILGTSGEVTSVPGTGESIIWIQFTFGSAVTLSTSNHYWAVVRNEGATTVQLIANGIVAGEKVDANGQQPWGVYARPSRLKVATTVGTTLTIPDSGIDHDATTNFVADEHVAHTGVTLTAGAGLAGGGDISANRTFSVNVDDATIEIDTDTLRVKADGINDTHIDWGTGANQVSAVDMPIADSGSYFVGTEVETALQEIGLETNAADSPMVRTGGDITTGTNAATFKVAALTALLRSTDSLTGTLTYISLAEQDNQSITAANTTYFICLDYNDGTPQIVLSTTNPYSRTASPDRTQIPIGKVMKDGSDAVHFISGGFSFQDGVRRFHQRAGSLRSKELASGSTIAYSGTNNFTMTAGVAYAGINRFVPAAYDSAVTQFTPVYRASPSGWTEGAASNVIDYAHYDDGDGTLGNVGVGRYGCFWVYKHIDDAHVYVRYGEGSYKLAEAEEAGEPTKPDHLTDFGLLIGKIIAPQAGGSFTTIQMVTDIFFTGTAVSDHNELGGLQGGTTDEYYHLTSAEYTNVDNWLLALAYNWFTM